MTERRSPNYPGIIAGAIVLFGWGAIWFTALGPAWRVAVGLPQSTMDAYGMWAYILAFLAGVLVSYCFDNMLWHYETGNAGKGAQVGVLTGVCIFAAMLVNLYTFESRSILLILIDGGYGIIGFTLTGAAVGAMRARAAQRAARTG